VNPGDEIRQGDRLEAIGDQRQVVGELLGRHGQQLRVGSRSGDAVVEEDDRIARSRLSAHT
jgi:hypothetical protein